MGRAERVNATQREIQQIQNERHLEIYVSMTPRGRWKWTSTLTGTDFLDGDWKLERSGIAGGRPEAFEAAIAAVKS